MESITQTSSKDEVISNAVECIDTLQEQLNTYKQQQLFLQAFVAGLLFVLVVF